MSDGSKRPYKKPHTRASVSHSATTSTPPNPTKKPKVRHIERARRGPPSRVEIVSMVGSPDARPPAGGDAPRAFPARRRRQRTSGHPPLAEFGRVASRLALAGLALACSGVARVAAADPNGSYEIHAAIDAAFDPHLKQALGGGPGSWRRLLLSGTFGPLPLRGPCAGAQDSASPRPPPTQGMVRLTVRRFRLAMLPCSHGTY